jgi:hypothetical protein
MHSDDSQMWQLAFGKGYGVTDIWKAIVASAAVPTGTVVVLA